MRKIALRAATASVAILGLVGACSKKDEQPPPAQPGQYPAYQQQPGQPGYPAGQQQYPQQPYPQQQQPGYPAAQQPYPQQQPYPATPAPAAPGAAPGTTSQPSAVAFPCQTDVQCLSHRCNMQVGKCSWPCQTNDDCMPGFQCVTPACVPTLPQQ
jgi:hypothetical protein